MCYNLKIKTPLGRGRGVEVKITIAYAMFRKVALCLKDYKLK